MILVFYRELTVIGRLECTLSLNFEGRIDLNAWYCPRCGRIFAKTLLHYEPTDIARLGGRPKFEYHLIRRACGDRLFNLYEPHPTMWNCANADLLNYVLKEHFDESASPYCRSHVPDPIEPGLFDTNDEGAGGHSGPEHGPARIGED